MKLKSSPPVLEELFENPTRVRLLKFFFHNFEKKFSTEELKKQLKIENRALKYELLKLNSIGILKSKIVTTSKKHSKSLFSKKRLYFTNTQFYFYPELKNLILKSAPISQEKLLNRIKKLGKIKLVVLAGIFINSEKSRGDLLIVGDKISQHKTNKFLENLEAEAGREINLIIMETQEFKYRYNMFDKFVRDFLEYPHKILINKLRL